MEGLLSALSAWAEPLVVFGLVVCAELFLLTTQGILMAVAWRRRAKGPAPRPASRALVLARRGLTLFCVLTLLGIAWVDRFHFESVVRLMLARVEAKSGTSLRYGAVEGTLWTGTFRFRDLVAARAGEHETTYDLRAGRADVDVGMLSTLFGKRVFERIELTRVRGDYARRARSEPGRTRRPFEVLVLVASDVEIEVADTARAELPFRSRLQLAQLDVRPLRSECLWFDLLFRSRAEGNLGGGPLSVTPKELGSGREVSWRLERLPMTDARPYLGVAAKVLRTGTVDVAMSALESADAPGRVRTRWFATLRDFAQKDMDAAGLGFVERKLVGILASQGTEVKLEFPLEVREEQFRGETSFDALPIFAGVAAALLEKLGVAMRLDPEELRAFGEGAKDAWKRGLDFLKKK